jgi:hypothetical protein
MAPTTNNPLTHSVVLVGIGERITDRGQDWRQHRGSHDGELQAVHKLGDPDNIMSDYLMRAARVMSHDDEVVDRRPDAGVVRRKGEMSPLVN